MRREIDLPLVEVGLSSAQYGALVVESVCIFFLSCVNMCVSACTSMCHVFSLCLCPPCCELVCT